MQQILEVVERLRKLKGSIAERKRGITIHNSEGTARKITVNTRKRGIVGTALLRHPLVSRVGLKIGWYGDTITLELRKTPNASVSSAQVQKTLRLSGYTSQSGPTLWVSRGKRSVALIGTRTLKKNRIVQSAEIDVEHFEPIARAILENK